MGLRLSWNAASARYSGIPGRSDVGGFGALGLMNCNIAVLKRSSDKRLSINARSSSVSLVFSKFS